jgi:hypothetical protein
MALAHRSMVILVAASFAFLAFGCASERETAQKALPPVIPTTVENWNGKIQRVIFVKKFQLTDYGKVVVAPVDVSGVKVPPPEDSTHAAVADIVNRTTDLLAGGMRMKLKDVTPVEIAGAANPASGKALLVRARVTDMNPGSQAQRYYVMYSAGGAYSAIEGEIVDQQTGETLVKFTDAEYRDGGMFSGGYSDLLSDEVMGCGQNVGLLIEAFSPPTPK